MSSASVWALVALGIVGSLFAEPAAADEPRLGNEPRMMREPGEPLNIADAFRSDDPFDIHVGTIYELSVENSRIARRRSSGVTEGIADYQRITSRLIPRVEVGLYHDLSVSLRAPIVLSDTRDLAAAAGGGVISGAGQTIAVLPFQATERSGLEHLALAVDLGLMNQADKRELPTWTVGLESRFSIGPVMRACMEDPPAGQVDCAHPGDVDRDGKRDPQELDFELPRGAGITRGTVQLVAKTGISRRIRYIEPFLIVRGRLEISLPGSLFDEVPDARFPPLVADAELGVIITPWEHRERFSRVVFATQALLGASSTGIDYGPLFDAIGTSVAPDIRKAKFSSTGQNYATGLSEVDAHLRLGGSGMVMWQASELIKLGIESAVSHAFSHEIASDSVDSPNHRGLLSDGGPLAVESTLLVDARFRGVMMF